MLKPILTGLMLLAVILSISCSKDSTPTTEPLLAAIEVETMPLLQGTIWTYSLYMTESSTRKHGDRVQYNLTITYGRLILSVPREVGSSFTRSWQLDSRAVIDSIRNESYLDFDLAETSLDLTPATYEQSHTIFYEQDTLWYQEKGKLVYMMPASLASDGNVNLRLFDLPGTSFFQAPIPFHARWESGDLIYLRRNGVEKSSVKINAPESVQGIWASVRVNDVPRLGDKREQELRYTLQEFHSPLLASNTNGN